MLFSRIPAGFPKLVWKWDWNRFASQYDSWYFQETRSPKHTTYIKSCIQTSPKYAILNGEN